VIIALSFTTDRPLSQEAGMEFWADGLRFRARNYAGPHHYQFTVRVTADDLVQAVTIAASLVETIAARHDAAATIVSVHGDLQFADRPEVPA
jgi:hypothetical protein